MKSLEKATMLKALTCLDKKLNEEVTLLVGGGGAMLMAHNFPLVTMDIDAVPLKKSFLELDDFVKQVAKELKLPVDWLNPWFSSFTHVLPQDYLDRVINVFQGKNITTLALGIDDLLIMKCFAHRPKDIGHARSLIKGGARLSFVRNHIDYLDDKGIPQSTEALDFLDDLEDEE